MFTKDTNDTEDEKDTKEIFCKNAFGEMAEWRATHPSVASGAFSERKKIFLV